MNLIQQGMILRIWVDGTPCIHEENISVKWSGIN